jgi:hypothetical protein
MTACHAVEECLNLKLGIDSERIGGSINGEQMERDV